MVEKHGLHRKIRIRPIRPSDHAVLREWLLDRSIQMRLEDEPLTAAAVRRKIRYYENPAYEDDSLHLIIDLDSSPVGLVHYVWQNFQSRTAEMDLLLSADHRQSMVAFLSILKAFNVGFMDLNLNKLYAFIYESNHESVALFRRITTLEAVLKGHLLRKGRPEDVYIFGLLASEYGLLLKRFKRSF